MRCKHINVSVDLDRIRASAERIRKHTGVALIAVIKADAYGAGAARVTDALAGVADDLAYFSVPEAREVGRPGLVLGPPEADVAAFRELNLRPMIANEQDARRYAGLPLAISVDTGMQRFGVAPEQVESLARGARVVDLYTHACDSSGADVLRSITCRAARKHAAATSLLDCPSTWLDAVRPGLALYRGATRVTTRLVSVRETHGPVGYTGFQFPHVGILLAGYSNGLAPASVVINGRRQRILEVGMNSCFVSVDPRDRAGDEVVLLGDELPEREIARELNVREHEVLCRYTSMGVREYAAVASAEPTPALDTSRSTVAAPPRT